MENLVAKAKKRPSLVAGIVVIILVIITIVVVSRPKRLSGTYSHTTDLLIAKSTDRLTFEGNQVIENEGQDYENQGTYQIKGDQLKMTIKGSTLSATLSSDKNSFTVNSSSGLEGLLAGTTYKKDN